MPPRPHITLDTGPMLRAVAANHRAWFRRQARLVGGESIRLGSTEIVIGDRWASLPFPGSATRLDAVMDAIRGRRVREMGCWSLQPDHRLGVELVARGFGWGWRPHWMAIETGGAGPAPGRHDVVSVQPPYADELPYRPGRPDPPAVIHLGVRRDGAVVGHVAVNPWRSIAGIYSMGVAPRYRRQGIGRELTLAACEVAAAHGCRAAVLNATDEGTRLYSACGFRSLGLGQTWWYFPGPVPTARQAALARATGYGDVAALARLRPRAAELRAPLPGQTSPLQLAVVAGQARSAAWMLERIPSLAAHRLEPHGGTLLHLAAEWDRPELVTVALEHGVDPQARDRSFGATALGWAEHFGRRGVTAALVAALAGRDPNR